MEGDGAAEIACNRKRPDVAASQQRGSLCPPSCRVTPPPLTTGLFLVSLISGIALFFHWGGGLFHGMHEWLSMVLIVPFVLHIWKNWRPFSTYFKRPAMGIALALSLVAAAAFMLPTGSQGSGNPLVAVLGKLQASSVETVAPVFRPHRRKSRRSIEGQGLHGDVDRCHARRGRQGQRQERHRHGHARSARSEIGAGKWGGRPRATRRSAQLSSALHCHPRESGDPVNVAVRGSRAESATPWSSILPHADTPNTGSRLSAALRPG